jgi:hypothetical protein
MSLKKEKAADKKEYIMKRSSQLKHEGSGANQGARKGRAMMRFFSKHATSAPQLPGQPLPVATIACSPAVSLSHPLYPVTISQAYRSVFSHIDTQTTRQTTAASQTIKVPFDQPNFRVSVGSTTLYYNFPSLISQQPAGRLSSLLYYICKHGLDYRTSTTQAKSAPGQRTPSA